MDSFVKVQKRHVSCALMIAAIGSVAIFTILSMSIDAQADVEFEQTFGYERIGAGHVQTMGWLVGGFLAILTVMGSIGAIVALPELEVEIDRRFGHAR